MRPDCQLLTEVRWNLFDEIGYVPNEEQVRLHRSRKRFIATLGGERAGKSMTAARHFLPYLVIAPNARLWIVASQLDTTLGVFEWFYHDLVAPCIPRNPRFPESKCLGWPVERAVFERKPPRAYIKFLNGAEIDTKTAKNLSAVRSIPVDAMIVSEAADMPGNTWDEYCRGRLSDRDGSAIIEGCPVGYGWHVALSERGLAGDPDWGVFHLNAENTLSEADLAEKKRNYSQPMYEQKVRGNPMTLEGLVYAPQFHDEESVIDWEYRTDWLTWLGIDFGYRFPALVWAQTNVADPSASGFQGVTFDQFVEDNVSIDRLCEEALGRPYELSGIFCDPSGRNSDTMGLSDVKRLQAACRQRGVVDPSYTNSPRWQHVPAGVEQVRALYQSADGARRWFLARRLVDNRVRRGFWRALHMYQYPDVRPGAVKSDEPVKDGVSDHIMDADRYLKINLIERARAAASPPRIAAKKSVFVGPRSDFDKGPVGTPARF